MKTCGPRSRISPSGEKRELGVRRRLADRAEPDAVGRHDGGEPAVLGLAVDLAACRCPSARYQRIRSGAIGAAPVTAQRLRLMPDRARMLSQHQQSRERGSRAPAPSGTGRPSSRASAQPAARADRPARRRAAAGASPPSCGWRCRNRIFSQMRGTAKSDGRRAPRAGSRARCRGSRRIRRSSPG